MDIKNCKYAVATSGGTINMYSAAKLHDCTDGIRLGATSAINGKTYYSKLNMSKCSIYGNTGYGIVIADKCSATISGGTVTGASALSGTDRETLNCIYINTGGSASISGSPVFKYASSAGINCYGTLKMNGGSITGAGGNGINGYSGASVTLSGGSISDNSGYAVYNAGTATISGGTIASTNKGTYGTVYQNGTMTVTSAVNGYIYLASDSRYVTTGDSTAKLNIRPNKYTDERVVIKTDSSACAKTQKDGTLYQKSGWYMKASGKNVVLCDEYTISVTAEDGIKSVTGAGVYHYGDAATLTAEPLTGYTGIQWGNGATGEKQTVTVKENKTYTVSAGRCRSTVTIDPAGGKWKGSGDTESYTREYGETLMIPDPVKEGGTVTYEAFGGSVREGFKNTLRYVFTGWKEESAGDGAEFSAGTLSGNIFTFGPVPDGKGVLKAEYKKSPVALPKAQKTGYTFTGWYTKENGGDFVGKEGDAFWSDEDITLYARYTRNSYTIIFNTNPISVNPCNMAGDKYTTEPVGKVDSITVMYGDDVTMPSGAGISRTGYTFTGWTNASHKSYPVYEAGKTYEALNLAEEDGAEVTLYATWKPVRYTVEYEMNLADTARYEDESVRFDAEYTLREAPERYGYVFKGWQIISGAEYNGYENIRETDPAKTEAGTYAAGSILKNVRKSEGTVTVCAIWEHTAGNYTVIWDGVPMDDASSHIHYTDRPYYSAIGKYTSDTGTYKGYYVNTGLKNDWEIDRTAVIKNNGGKYEITGYGYYIVTSDGKMKKKYYRKNGQHKCKREKYNNHI